MEEHPKDFFAQLQRLCLAGGVKVVHTPCIKKAPINGATRWLKYTPLIQLTGRYKRNDVFWFTFFHEAGHILLHGKKDIYLEQIEYSDRDIQKEDEADRFAVKWTLTIEGEKALLERDTFHESDVVAFAKRYSTHPAIIVGRLQRDKKVTHSFGRRFLINVELDA